MKNIIVVAAVLSFININAQTNFVNNTNSIAVSSINANQEKDGLQTIGLNNPHRLKRSQSSGFYATSESSGKSFEKNTNVIAFGLDLGLYSYTSKIQSNPTSDQSAALNKMLSLQYERGVINWLGVGAKVQLSDYFTETDSVTNTKPSIRAIDATLLVNAHFVRAKYVDMLAGFNVGYSYMNWEARDEFISGATGGGLTFDIHLQPRFYFGKHVGMFINLAYVNYAYNNMDFKNTFTNYSDVLSLKGGGVNFGIGFQGKF